MLGALWMALMLVAGPAAAAQNVGLKVAIIQASKATAEPDPALAKLQGELEKAFGGFKSFKQLDKTELKLQQGAKVTLKLPDGEDAELTYTGEKNGRHGLKLAIPASKVEVDLTAPLRKMFYQAGIKHDDGILILALYLTPP
jgi:hypothetical protein